LMVLLADICVERYEEQLAARIAAYKAENPSAAGAEVGALIFDEVCRIRGFSVRKTGLERWRECHNPRRRSRRNITDKTPSAPGKVRGRGRLRSSAPPSKW